MRKRGPGSVGGGVLAVALLGTGCAGGDGSVGVEVGLAAAASSWGPTRPVWTTPVPAVAADPAGRSHSVGLPPRSADPPATTPPARPVGVLPGPVRPAPGPLCSGAGWEQRRGVTMLARIGYPYRGLAFSIHFRPARAGHLGFTSYAARRIEIYVRPCSRESDVVLTHTIAHEIGHAVDYTLGDPGRRARWQQARGIATSTPWYGCSTCPDYHTPAGDFAETFAYWQVGPADYRSTMARPPTPAQLRTLGSFFWS